MACAAQLGQTGTSTASDQGHIPSVKGQHYSGRGEAAQEDLPAAGQSKAAEALFEIAGTPSGTADAGPEHDKQPSSEQQPFAGVTGTPSHNIMIQVMLLWVCA